MEAWGGSGGSWESSCRHSGLKTVQSSKILEKNGDPPLEARQAAKIGPTSNLEAFFDVFVVPFFEVSVFNDFQ